MVTKIIKAQKKSILLTSSPPCFFVFKSVKNDPMSSFRKLFFTGHSKTPAQDNQTLQNTKPLKNNDLHPPNSGFKKTEQ